MTPGKDAATFPIMNGVGEGRNKKAEPGGWPVDIAREVHQSRSGHNYQVGVRAKRAAEQATARTPMSEMAYIVARI